MKGVSVLVINLNGEQFLKQLLPSITIQYCQNIEVVFVDGGSQDGSVELFESYSFREGISKHSIQNKDEVNIVESYNLALNAASYDYVAMPGVDDCYLDRFWLTRCIEFLDSDKSYGMVFGRSLIVDENFIFKSHSFNAPLGYNSSDDQLLYFISRNFFPIDVNMVIRTNIIKTCFPLFTSNNECDIFTPHLSFFRDFFAFGHKCFFMNVLATYSITPNNYSSRRQIKYKVRESSCTRSVLGLRALFRLGRKSRVHIYALLYFSQLYRSKISRLLMYFK